MEENHKYLDDLLDGSLLDGGRLLKAISVDASQQVLSDAHRVECWDNIDLLGGLELDLLELIIKRLACTGTHSEIFLKIKRQQRTISALFHSCSVE